MANNAVNKIDRMFLVTDCITFNKVSSLLTISNSSTRKNSIWILLWIYNFDFLIETYCLVIAWQHLKVSSKNNFKKSIEILEGWKWQSNQLKMNKIARYFITLKENSLGEFKYRRRKRDARIDHWCTRANTKRCSLIPSLAIFELRACWRSHRFPLY